MTRRAESMLFSPLSLPCGVVLKNRIVKSAMSDSMGDGRGDPGPFQADLYERWARGGLAAAIIGEVQGDPLAAEKPGNLVLGPKSNTDALRRLADAGRADGAHLWLQLGHAGALTDPAIGQPRGPSALNLPGLRCASLTLDEIEALPGLFGATARQARDLGFGGVQVHAAHGFLLSQFLSPLFNKRTDDWGGSLENRMRLPLAVVEAVRRAVGPDFPVAIKVNASDLLDGGLEEDESLRFLAALDKTTVDLIDISGGTYFPGAASSSDRRTEGPYFLAFARRARQVTTKHLMATGGFKTVEQARDAVARGDVDLVGLARALILDPDLPRKWADGEAGGPAFPRFASPPEGGVTAWYTMQITALAQHRPIDTAGTLPQAIADYADRDRARVVLWRDRFQAG
ncbi:oxidoreductase [Jannaschia sp. M317]|nr:oxidoreductase [Jannaschia sp. M317]